ncbi:MAG: hypothetical protein R3F61_11450 [Myxococcota bacterium]
MSGKQQRPKQVTPPVRTSERPRTPPRSTQQPPRTTAPKPSGDRQFGTGSTDQENHVHVPPELLPDIYGNEFMKTMLA